MLGMTTLQVKSGEKEKENDLEMFFFFSLACLDSKKWQIESNNGEQ